jgi:hypothetical protein
MLLISVRGNAINRADFRVTFRVSLDVRRRR